MPAYDLTRHFNLGLYPILPPKVLRMKPGWKRSVGRVSKLLKGMLGSPEEVKVFPLPKKQTDRRRRRDEWSSDGAGWSPYTSSVHRARLPVVGASTIRPFRTFLGPWWVIVTRPSSHFFEETKAIRHGGDSHLPILTIPTGARLTAPGVRDPRSAAALGGQTPFCRVNRELEFLRLYGCSMHMRLLPSEAIDGCRRVSQAVLGIASAG